MSKRQLHLDVVNMSLPASLTATIASTTGVEYDDASAATIISTFGTSSGTLDGSNLVKLILEDSADGTTYAAVTNAKYALGLTPDASGYIATIDDAAEDDQSYVTQYVGPKRFARVRPVVTGAAVVVPFSIIAVKGYKNRNGL